MRKIKMPSYDYIKSLSTVDPDYEDCYKDYSWVLFETVGTTGMLTYNKDDEKTLYFYIEGDTIELENVKCDSVRGHNIKIGENCRIKMVEYTGSIEIDKKSKVEEFVSIK